MKTNRLLTLSDPVFAIADWLLFSGEENSAISYAFIQQRATQALDEFKQQAQAEKIDPQEIEWSQYALVAWLDELCMSQPWAGQAEWIKAPLQIQFMGEHLAGEGFYQRLNQCLIMADVKREVLQVYATCLWQGFIGLYKTRGKQVYEELISQVKQRLVTLQPQNLNHVPSDVNNSKWRQWLMKLKPKVIIAASGILVVMIYLIATLAMNVTIDHYQNQLPQQLEMTR